MKIVIPILYTGGIIPESPKEGDIWINDYISKIYVYLDNDWFEIQVQEDTGYTEMQKEKMQKRKKTEQLKLDKYKKVLRTFKQLLDEID